MFWLKVPLERPLARSAYDCVVHVSAEYKAYDDAFHHTYYWTTTTTSTSSGSVQGLLLQGVTVLPQECRAKRTGISTAISPSFARGPGRVVGQGQGRIVGRGRVGGQGHSIA